MLALALSLCLAFPDDVVVATRTEAIGIDQLFAVREGKLWEKRAGAWTLFKSTGMPPGVTRPIVAVFADEISHFTVVTDDGFMHHHENDVWDSLWGLPSLPVGRTPLALPFPLRDLREGRFAYSMRRDHAQYYEDTLGQQFFWGDVGCTSLFALADDDTRILFGDPWVAPDWSREVCGPARGSVRIAAIAASASVLFVIARNGEMFTRFDDYDHNGGTPLFHYAYGPHPRQSRLGTDPASAIQIRALPGHDWRAQPPIPLTGNARVSRRIAIVQNGVGNDARELRVIGDDPEGARGVYTKQVADAAWRFTAKELPVDDDAWLDPLAPAHASPRAIAMAGALRAPPALGHVWARTDDFSFHCSPFTLTLELAGTPSEVKLIAHAVDAWTIFPHANPVDDDTAQKLLKITLQLAPGQELPAATSARLDELMQGRLGETFAFVGVANQHELVIVPLGYPFTGERSRWQLTLRSDPRERALRHVNLRPASRVVAREPQCRAALDAIRAQRADIERRLALFSTLEVALPAGLGATDVATIASTTRYTWETIRWLTALELHVPAVLAAPSLAYSRWLASSRADFDAVERQLSAECGP